jgi:hypothetical protein
MTAYIGFAIAQTHTVSTLAIAADTGQVAKVCAV